MKGLRPGAVREVPPVLGNWLIAEEYADSEMRRGDDPDNARERGRRQPVVKERRERRR